MKKPKDVSTYIESAPKESRPKLKELRKIIKAAAPLAEEKISYGMPYYAYKGRLAYFQLAKNHIGLYIPTPTIAELAEELKGYAVSKATIHFPLDKELPVRLIQKVIKARVKKNEAKGKSKKK